MTLSSARVVTHVSWLGTALLPALLLLGSVVWDVSLVRHDHVATVTAPVTYRTTHVTSPTGVRRGPLTGHPTTLMAGIRPIVVAIALRGTNASGDPDSGATSSASNMPQPTSAPPSPRFTTVWRFQRHSIVRIAGSELMRSNQPTKNAGASGPNAMPGVVPVGHETPSGQRTDAERPSGWEAVLPQQDFIAMLILGGSLVAAGFFAIVWKLRRPRERLPPGRPEGGGSLPNLGLHGMGDGTHRSRLVGWNGKGRKTRPRPSETMLQDLLHIVDHAVIVTREVDGAIRFWSQGCVRTYGWQPEQALGESFHVLLQTQFPRPLPEIEQELLDKGRWTGDLVHRRRDGARVVVCADMALRRHPDGTPDLVTETLVDVTALREAELKLRAINEDLEHRVQAEIDARQAAQQRAAHNDRIQALGQLAGGIAHDFNNILQAITGGAALIARHPRDTEMVSRFVGIISDAAARGGSITRRILLLARRGDLKAEPLNTGSLLAEVRDTFSLTLGLSIQIQVDVGPDLPLVMADRVQLETALVNLATNARDAMPDNGDLRLAARLDVVRPEGPAPAIPLRPGRYICISVTDNGHGMNQATLARVGEPFFTTKGIGKGTGLGLSMVKGFAEQSGGGFAIESQQDLGTTASVCLPVAEPDALGPDYTTPYLAQRVARILLVDDDPLVLGTVAEQLEDLGYKVMSAPGGTDALDILRDRQAIDLMITDLSMPGMNGLSLIQEAQEMQPRLRAILLTGYANELGRLAAEACARPDYTLIRKPASTAVLKARITELLAQD